MGQAARDIRCRSLQAAMACQRRYTMQLLLRLTALLALIVTPLHAADLSIEEYGYPRPILSKRPSPARRAHCAPRYPVTTPSTKADYSLRLRPEREFTLPDNFWPVKQLRYRPARQRGPAPLIFIISGTGAHYSAGKTEALKRLFYGAGYHVVQLSSPTSYDFMSAASRYATPASVPTMPRTSIGSCRPFAPGITSCLSPSSTSPATARRAERGVRQPADETRGSFNFKRVLLLNPPVNLYTSVGNPTNWCRPASTVSTTTPPSMRWCWKAHPLLPAARLHRPRRGDALRLPAVGAEAQRRADGHADRLGVPFFRRRHQLHLDLINRRGLIVPQDYPINEGTRPSHSSSAPCFATSTATSPSS